MANGNEIFDEYISALSFSSQPFRVGQKAYRLINGIPTKSQVLSVQGGRTGYYVKWLKRE